MRSAKSTMTAWPGVTVIWKPPDSIEIPPKITSTISPNHTSTRFAYRRDGSRKDGTALLMASTPVMAEQPLENARSSRIIMTGWVMLVGVGAMKGGFVTLPVSS